MAITKEIIIGKIEVVTDFKHIQVRSDTVIKEDGKELSRTYKRHIVSSDISSDDLARQDTEVQQVANSGIWTQAVKDAWTAQKESL